jgi:YD repeat-containing protein
MNTATGTGTVSVTDPDGNTTVDYYTQGALAAESVWTGSALTSQQDYAPDTTAGGTSGGTLLDTSASDGNGNTTTQTFDPAGNLVTQTSPTGVSTQTATTSQWSTALDQPSCTATAQAASPCSSTQTGPTPVAPGGVITPASSAPPQGVTYTLYDTDGNVLYSTTRVFEPGSNTGAVVGAAGVPGGGPAQPVVAAAPVGVGECVVGFGDFPESLRGVGVVVDVGVVLLGEPAVGPFDFSGRRGGCDAEDGVVVLGVGSGFHTEYTAPQSSHSKVRSRISWMFSTAPHAGQLTGMSSGS